MNPKPLLVLVISLIIMILSAWSYLTKKRIAMSYYDIGDKTSLTYSSDGLPLKIEHGFVDILQDKDVKKSNKFITRSIDSIVYNLLNKTILLVRIYDLKDSIDATNAYNYRKFYFNDKNLLYKITQFDDSTNVEYSSDSIVYDFENRKAFHYNLLSKGMVVELHYDMRNNIVSQYHHEPPSLYMEHHFDFDSYDNPFLIHLRNDEKLFGCFHIKSLGLFWSAFSKPLYCSSNNEISSREVITIHGQKDEFSGNFSLKYRNNLPTIADYGGVVGAQHYVYK